MRGLLDAIPPRWQRALAVLLGMALSVYVLQAVADVVIPFLSHVLDVLSPLIIGFAIAYVLDPVVGWLESKGRSRAFAIIVVVMAALGVAAVTALVVIPSGVQQVTTLAPKFADRISDLADALADRLGPRYVEGVARLQQALRDTIEHPDWQRLADPASAWAQRLLASGRTMLGVLLDLVLVPVIAVYLLADMADLKRRATELIPPRRRAAILEPMRDIDRVLTGFVRGQLKVAVILGVLYTAGLLLTRTPLAVPIGLFAGAVSFVPYLGVALGLLPALLLNLLAHQSLPLALGVVGTFAVAHFLEGNFITPRIMADATGLHPVMVIVALMIGGSFFGIAGLVLAVPVMAASMVLIRRGHSQYAQSEFFHGARRKQHHPPSEPPG